MKTYPYLNILMFPTTECNLRCRYCFHAKGEYRKEQMSIHFIERVFEVLFPYYEYLQFIWHGGEPLCVDINFYKQVIDLEKKYSELHGTIVDNGIMTNGTLVTDEWANFFYNNNFDVGVSFDGIDNDALRGKTSEVEKGIKELISHDCDVDIVAVLTNKNLFNQIENYEYIKHFKSEIKFNPVAKIGGGETCEDCVLEEETYIEQCIKVFEYWLYDCNQPVILNPYYTYLRDIINNTSSGCQRTSCLGRWIALYPNGDIFPCVRENRETHKLGNILLVKNIEEIWDSPIFTNILDDAVKHREKCINCSVYKYCHGGCPVNNMTNNGDFSCRTFKKVFKYVLNKYEYLLSNKEHEIAELSINPLVKELIWQND